MMPVQLQSSHPTLNPLDLRTAVGNSFNTCLNDWHQLGEGLVQPDRLGAQLLEARDDPLTLDHLSLNLCHLLLEAPHSLIGDLGCHLGDLGLERP